jgi:hypothetical protein
LLELQVKPLLQSVTRAQLLGQLPLLGSHRYGAHWVAVPSRAVDVDPSVLQVAPCTHLLEPTSQMKLCAQSLVDVQLVLHWVSSQVYGTHDLGAGVLHVPRLHVETSMSVSPEQVAGAHVVVVVFA